MFDFQQVPPEIVRPRTGQELKKSDMWSIGIITYILVCGRVPFEGESYKEILDKITAKRKHIDFPLKSIRLTNACKNFIESLLCYDIEKRLSAAEALKHPVTAFTFICMLFLCLLFIYDYSVDLWQCCL